MISQNVVKGKGCKLRIFHSTLYNLLKNKENISTQIVAKGELNRNWKTHWGSTSWLVQKCHIEKNPYLKRNSVRESKKVHTNDERWKFWQDERSKTTLFTANCKEKSKTWILMLQVIRKQMFYQICWKTMIYFRSSM